MKIIIPMAGRGSRFEEAGYTLPKPLIDIHGKPMIQVVVENLGFIGEHIFIVQKEHNEMYDLHYTLEKISPGCRVIEIDEVTEGAACTTLLAKEFITDESLIIANSDQWIDWDSDRMVGKIHEEYTSGTILTFKGSDPHFSYAKSEPTTKYITEVAEKKVISEDATVGVYLWRKGTDYVKYAEQMIEKDIRTNGEFYVCPVFNEAIADGKRFRTHSVDNMYSLGTPEELEVFKKLKSL